MHSTESYCNGVVLTPDANSGNARVVMEKPAC